MREVGTFRVAKVSCYQEEYKSAFFIFKKFVEAWKKIWYFQIGQKKPAPVARSRF
jgi:hypothetical protein